MAHSNSRSLNSPAKFPRIPLRYTHRKPTNLFSRTRNVTKLASAASASSTANADLFLRRDSNVSRRQSLPPICRNQSTSNDKYDREMGGETSGYGSDNPNNTPEYLQQTTWNQSFGGYESSSSARDDRAKWGDRGVGIGKFWEPQDIRYYNKMNDTPGWVKRGLQGDTELIVSNTSPAESPEQDFGDQRPYTGSSNSHTRTYIRGQNNPVDPVELAERERKRQLALAHQEAIKQQLEEREQRRQIDREKRIREEREEELRIERDQEIERQRREHEDRVLREKQEREKKRKQALQEAIQLAEREAQEQKHKLKLMKQVNININENVEEKEKVVSPRPIGDDTSKNNNIKVNNNNEAEEENQKPNNVSLAANNTHHNNINEKKENNIDRVLPKENNSPPIQSSLGPPPAPPTSVENVTVNPSPNVTESVPMLLQTPSFDGFSGIPFAIIMPTFNTGPTPSLPVPVAVPMQVNTEQTPRPRTQNRILTPTQYRHRQFCDSSTQTDFPGQSKAAEADQNKEIKYVRERMNNLDVNYDGRNRKGSLRHGENNSSGRPKWGANRPPTRYMKQSEKDPFYQRKKTRQKIRQIKLYDDKNNNYSPRSSDDSQTASPRTYRKKGYIEKRRTRALWQKNEQVFSRNVQVYQTEIVPLESDKDQIYFKKPDCIKCCCDCRSEKHKYENEVKVVDILKIEDSPRGEVQYENRDGCLPECNNSIIDSDVLEKLNCLHNGLMMKQEQWQNTPRTPSLCSPMGTADINR